MLYMRQYVTEQYCLQALAESLGKCAHVNVTLAKMEAIFIIIAIIKFFNKSCHTQQ